MSALQRQTYANSTQPLFLPASGGGGQDLTLTELNINQGGNITLGSSINQATQLIFNKSVDGVLHNQLIETYIAGDSGAGLALTLADNNDRYDNLQVGNVFVFGDNEEYTNPNYLSLNGTTTNVGLSYGTPDTRVVFADVSGTNLNLYSSVVGPNPVSFVTGGPFAVNPVPTSPAAFGNFFLAPLYPTTSGQEYDVCCKGTIALVSGTPDPTIPDEFTVSVSVGGTGNGTQKYSFNPNYLTFTVRDRLISNASTPSIVVGVQNTRKGTSTAVYSAAITMGDVVRVA